MDLSADAGTASLGGFRLAGLTQIALLSPVWVGGSVVDLRLREARDGCLGFLVDELGAVAHEQPLGRLASELCGGKVHNGVLGRMLQVAENGSHFAVSTPATADGRRQGRRYYVQRSPAGDVMVVSRLLQRTDQLREQQEQDGPRWRRAFAEAPMGVCISSFSGTIIDPSNVLCSLLGRTRDELVGVSFRELAHPEDRHLEIDRATLEATGRFELTKRYLRGDGTVLWARAVIAAIEEGEELRLLSFIEDIGDAVQSQLELSRLATEDALTGLPNRPAFRRLMRAALAGPVHPALLFVDLDQFKIVNDSLGHDAGDQLLRQVARTLVRCVGPRGVVGRLGGDEFVVLVHDPVGAEAVAADVVDALTGTERLGTRDVTVGASVGLAYAGPGTRDDVLMRDADTALYAAKRAGRGQCIVFDRVLRAKALARLDDEAALRLGLLRGEVIAHYQPAFDGGGALQAVEALVRWQRPGAGLLEPAAFLAMAEETGLVVELGREVLRQGAAELARWRIRAPDLRLSVNVAPAHIMGGALLEDVERTLARYGLPYEALILELTESAIVAGGEVTRTMHLLRSRGCRIAVDDFGTGFSSLAYLRDFPVDILKVDRSFIAGSSESRGATLLQGICGLGRSLGLLVICEGIETEHEREIALGANSDLLQGYLLGAPVSAAAMTDLLDELPVPTGAGAWGPAALPRQVSGRTVNGAAAR
ncbi:MAG: hypothetical protein JWL64_2721 [Frankiales bacterium]|nr:hypothetical protein [Frankiales bacterium]